MSIVYTIQPTFVLDTLEKTGEWIPSKQACCGGFDETDWTWSIAYSWIRDQLIQKVGHPEQKDQYMVWAWAPREPEKFSLDTRTRLYRTWSSQFDKYAILTLDIPEDEILVSDYEYWHFALNYWFLADEKESDKFYELCKKSGVNLKDHTGPMPEPFNQKIKDSWEKIFHPEALAVLEPNTSLEKYFENATHQCIFWKIKESQIKNIKFFSPSKKSR